MALNKQYLQTQIASADPEDHKSSVRFATTGSLPAYNRVGNVITATANGALPAQDGITPVQGNSLLLVNGASDSDNGIYVVTQLGDGGSPFILTRRGDADTDEFVTAGMRVPVAEGTLYAGQEFVLMTPDPIVLNMTGLTFEAFEGGGGGYAPVVLSAEQEMVPEGKRLLYAGDIQVEDDADLQLDGDVMPVDSFDNHIVHYVPTRQTRVIQENETMFLLDDAVIDGDLVIDGDATSIPIPPPFVLTGQAVLDALSEVIDTGELVGATSPVGGLAADAVRTLLNVQDGAEKNVPEIEWQPTVLENPSGEDLEAGKGYWISQTADGSVNLPEPVAGAKVAVMIDPDGYKLTVNTTGTGLLFIVVADPFRTAVAASIDLLSTGVYEFTCTYIPSLSANMWLCDNWMAGGYGANAHPGVITLEGGRITYKYLSDIGSVLSRDYSGLNEVALAANSLFGRQNAGNPAGLPAGGMPDYSVLVRNAGDIVAQQISEGGILTRDPGGNITVKQLGQSALFVRNASGGIISQIISDYSIPMRAGTGDWGSLQLGQYSLLLRNAGFVSTSPLDAYSVVARAGAGDIGNVILGNYAVLLRNNGNIISSLIGTYSVLSRNGTDIGYSSIGTKQLLGRAEGNSGTPSVVGLSRYTVEHNLQSGSDTDYTVSASGDQGDWIPGAYTSWMRCRVLRINTGSPGMILRGLESYEAFDDSVLDKVLWNIGQYPIIIKNNAATYAWANLNTPGGEDYILAPGESCRVVYDNNSSVDAWRVLGRESKAVVYPNGQSGTAAAFPTTTDGLWMGADVYRLYPLSSALTIHGFRKELVQGSYAGAAASKKFVINESASYTVTIKHNSGTATAVDRVLTNTGADVVLSQGECGLLLRDETADRWRFKKLPEPSDVIAQYDTTLAEQTLTDAATIAYDVSAGRNANVTLGGDRVLNFTNTVAGQRGMVRVIQDGSPPRLLTYSRGGVGGNVIFPGGSPPALTNAASAVDVLEWYDDGSKIHLKAFSLDSK